METTLLTNRENPVFNYNKKTKTVEVEGNVSLRKLLEYLDKFDRYISVLPGSSRISIAGCIAANIHGKNHHIVGSFSEVVEEFLLNTGDDLFLCSRTKNEKLFNATFGGMGLTGEIVKITLKTAQKPSYVKVNSDSYFSLEEMFVKLNKYRSSNFSAIALLNGQKSILGEGDIIYYENQYSKEFQPKYNNRKNYLSVIFPFINRFTIKIYNKIAFPVRYVDKIFHPLNMIFLADKHTNANLWFGRKGFIEYQFSIPKDQTNVAFAIMRDFHKHFVIYLSGIKILGEKSNGIIDFTQDGYTITLTTTPSEELYSKLNEYDLQLIRSKGRVYLAKDSRLSSKNFESMYNSVDGFRELRKSYMLHRFSSDLSRRLKI
jgi:hypothetical protein